MEGGLRVHSAQMECVNYSPSLSPPLLHYPLQERRHLTAVEWPVAIDEQYPSPHKKGKEGGRRCEKVFACRVICAIDGRRQRERERSSLVNRPVKIPPLSALNHSLMMVGRGCVNSGGESRNLLQICVRIRALLSLSQCS